MVTGQALRAVRMALLVGAAFVMLGLAATAGASHTAKVIAVRPSTLIQMSGTDIYCTVLSESAGATVACFHDPGGSSSSQRKGYAIVASDVGIAVEPSGSNTPVVSKREPPLASTPFSGGRASSTLVKLVANEAIKIGGTHMVIAIEPFADVGKSAAVVFADANGNPLNGTYAVAIGNRDVVVAKVSGQSFHTVYEHGVYS